MIFANGYEYEGCKGPLTKVVGITSGWAPQESGTARIP